MYGAEQLRLSQRVVYMCCDLARTLCFVCYLTHHAKRSAKPSQSFIAIGQADDPIPALTPSDTRFKPRQRQLSGVSRIRCVAESR
jgi:hypothetical protein